MKVYDFWSWHFSNAPLSAVDWLETDGGEIVGRIWRICTVTDAKLPWLHMPDCLARFTEAEKPKIIGRWKAERS